jgi:CheY-like chemotaxis protein
MAKAIYNRLYHKENCIDNCSAMMLQQMHELEDQYSETELLLEEVQQQSDELFEANERMTELASIKSDFVSTISQELRAPLTSVIGYSKVVKKRLDEVVLPEVKSEDEKVVRTVKQVGDNMNHIISEGERITVLINDIMDIAKLDNGKVVGKGEKISVAKIIEKEIEGQKHPSSKNTLAKYLKEYAASVMPTDTGKKKILTIDNEDSTRKFLRGEFERRGYIVYEATDGIEAIECMKVIKPDVITLDVMMPSMNGFDVAAIIKNDPKTKDIPIIILSTVEDRKRGFDIGVDGYLTKPIDMVALMKEIEKLPYVGMPN